MTLYLDMSVKRRPAAAAGGGEQRVAVAGTGELRAAPTDTGIAYHVSRLLDRERDWERDEVLDVLHWMRQILGLSLGIVWGAIPLVGGLWLLLFVVGTSILVFAYYSLLLKLDADDYGGHPLLLGEGFMPSIGTFLLTWILLYSTLHF